MREPSISLLYSELQTKAKKDSRMKDLTTPQLEFAPLKGKKITARAVPRALKIREA